MNETLWGLMLPFTGTLLGAACVFFMKGGLSERVQRALSGFAAGVMIAASVWSLILPSIEQSESYGMFSFVPATVGVWTGIGFLLILDKIIPHLHLSGETEGLKSKLARSSMLVLAVTLHNLPEGMAVGVVLAGFLQQNTNIGSAAVFSLALGIAIQNFPEGAIISMPLKAEGNSRKKAFALGALSGVVEPIGALVTLLAASVLTPVLPYLLSFAAGAMLYVVVEELIPEMSEGEHSHIGTLWLTLGFTAMMILDVALG